MIIGQLALETWSNGSERVLSSLLSAQCCILKYPDSYVQSQVEITTAPLDATDEQFRLVDFLIVLAKRKRLILKVALVCTCLAIGYTLLLPPEYTAQTTVMPPTQNQSAVGMMMGQLGVLASAGGGLNLKSPNDIYIGLLHSETIAQQLVDRFDLKRVYKCKRAVEARKLLEKHSNVATSKEGLIVVSVVDRDPQRATDIANEYVRDLQKLTGSLAVTEAGQRRLFFEQQLKQAKDTLADAEVALKQTQERTGVVQLDAQSRAIIESVALTRAQIAAKEVQVESLKSFATDQNPDLKIAQTQLAALNEQLAKLLHNSGHTDSDIGIPTEKLPEAGLDYIRRYRDVRYQETIFELLAKQYEAAKIDEAKEGAVVQVVDPAIVPEGKSGPRRKLIVLITLFVSLILGTIWALLKEGFQRTAADPVHRARLDMLKGYLWPVRW